MTTPRTPGEQGLGRGPDPAATQTMPAMDDAAGAEGEHAGADEDAIPSRVGRYLVLGRVG
jgi:hypothetical protein